MIFFDRRSNTYTNHWQFMKFDDQIHTQIIDSSWNSMIKYTHRSLTVHEIRLSNTHTNHWQFMKFDDQIHTKIIDSSWNSIIKYTHKSLTVHEIRLSNTHTNHWQFMKFDCQIHTETLTVYEIRLSNAHTNHWQFMKFDDFSEFQNVINDSPRPHSRASVWRIAYENRYVTHPLIEIFGNATTFHHFETSINSIETLSFFRQFELQDWD